MRVLRDFVVDALSAATGPDLLTALVDLTGREDLSAREWAEVTTGWKRMEGFAAAGQLTAIAELDQALSQKGGSNGYGGPVGPAPCGGPRTSSLLYCG